VHDAPAYAGDRVSLKLDAAIELVLVDGIDEAEDAETDQVVVFDAGRQAGGDADRHVLHQGDVLFDQDIASFRVGCSLVIRPRARGRLKLLYATLQTFSLHVRRMAKDGTLF